MRRESVRLMGEKGPSRRRCRRAGAPLVQPRASAFWRSSGAETSASQNSQTSCAADSKWPGGQDGCWVG
eukprot:3512742-Pyramimonas_sp.AAC.1